MGPYHLCLTEFNAVIDCSEWFTRQQSPNPALVHGKCTGSVLEHVWCRGHVAWLVPLTSATQGPQRLLRCTPENTMLLDGIYCEQVQPGQSVDRTLVGRLGSEVEMVTFLGHFFFFLLGTVNSGLAPCIMST